MPTPRRSRWPTTSCWRRTRTSSTRSSAVAPCGSGDGSPSAATRYGDFLIQVRRVSTTGIEEVAQAFTAPDGTWSVPVWPGQYQAATFGGTALSSGGLHGWGHHGDHERRPGAAGPAGRGPPRSGDRCRGAHPGQCWGLHGDQHQDGAPLLVLLGWTDRRGRLLRGGRSQLPAVLRPGGAARTGGRTLRGRGLPRRASRVRPARAPGGPAERPGDRLRPGAGGGRRRRPARRPARRSARRSARHPAPRPRRRPHPAPRPRPRRTRVRSRLLVGIPRVGAVLAVISWPRPGTTVARQWLRDGTPIPSATGSLYAVQRADRGKLVSARLTYTRTDGTFSVATTRALRIK